MYYILFSHNNFLKSSLKKLGRYQQISYREFETSVSVLLREHPPIAVVLDFSTRNMSQSYGHILYFLTFRYPELQIVILTNNNEAGSFIEDFPQCKQCDISRPALTVLDDLNSFLHSDLHIKKSNMLPYLRLSNKQVSIIYMFLTGHSIMKIARLLNTEIKVVYSHYYFAMRRLRSTRLYNLLFFKEFFVDYIESEYYDTIRKLSYKNDC